MKAFQRFPFKSTTEVEGKPLEAPAPTFGHVPLAHLSPAFRHGRHDADPEASGKEPVLGTGIRRIFVSEPHMS